MNLRLGDRRRALQKIEVAAFVRLADMLRIHRPVAARITRRRRRPGGAAARKFLVAHMQMDAARGDVDLDLVAGLAPRASGPPTKLSGATCKMQAP